MSFTFARMAIPTRRTPKPCLICGTPTTAGPRCTAHAIPPLGHRRWNQLSAAILAANDICHLCQQPGADTVDHITPRAHGGTHDPRNLAPAHRSCNSRKGTGA